MSKKYNLSHDELALFKSAIGKTKKFTQDTVVHKPQLAKNSKSEGARFNQEKIDTEFYFSDDYHPILLDDPIRYLREQADPYVLKKLGRGYYEPLFFLDLHGLTQLEAKREIAALLVACLREDAQCASIMYGHGKNILKQQVPRWLAQHPSVICFHQAPKEFGGSAALLILLDIDLRENGFDLNI